MNMKWEVVCRGNDGTEDVIAQFLVETDAIAWATEQPTRAARKADAKYRKDKAAYYAGSQRDPDEVIFSYGWRPVTETEYYGVVRWLPGDIQSLKPDWTEKQCEDWLVENSKFLRDRITELGWEVIEALLD